MTTSPKILERPFSSVLNRRIHDDRCDLATQTCRATVIALVICDMMPAVAFNTERRGRCNTGLESRHLDVPYCLLRRTENKSQNQKIYSNQTRDALGQSLSCYGQGGQLSRGLPRDPRHLPGGKGGQIRPVSLPAPPGRPRAQGCRTEHLRCLPRPGSAASPTFTVTPLVICHRVGSVRRATC